MKGLLILCRLGLITAAACPLEQLKEAGLLNEADLAKYEKIKRGGGHLEERANKELLPSVISPSLTLPLGGGLSKSHCSG